MNGSEASASDPSCVDGALGPQTGCGDAAGCPRAPSIVSASLVEIPRRELDNGIAAAKIRRRAKTLIGAALPGAAAGGARSQSSLAIARRNGQARNVGTGADALSAGTHIRPHLIGPGECRRAPNAPSARVVPISGPSFAAAHWSCRGKFFGTARDQPLDLHHAVPKSPLVGCQNMGLARVGSTRSRSYPYCSPEDVAMRTFDFSPLWRSQSASTGFSTSSTIRNFRNSG